MDCRRGRSLPSYGHSALSPSALRIFPLPRRTAFREAFSNKHLTRSCEEFILLLLKNNSDVTFAYRATSKEVEGISNRFIGSTSFGNTPSFSNPIGTFL